VTDPVLGRAGPNGDGVRPPFPLTRWAPEDTARLREFQAGMARLTAWMRRLDADCVRFREFEGRPR
jgi:hypothetical protein